MFVVHVFVINESQQPQALQPPSRIQWPLATDSRRGSDELADPCLKGSTSIIENITWSNLSSHIKNCRFMINLLSILHIYIYLYLYISIALSLSLSIYLSIYLPTYLPTYIYICIYIYIHPWVYHILKEMNRQMVGFWSDLVSSTSPRGARWLGRASAPERAGSSNFNSSKSTYIYIYIHIFIYIYAYIYIRTYIHTYIYIRTYIHIYMNMMMMMMMMNNIYIYDEYLQFSHQKGKNSDHH